MLWGFFQNHLFSIASLPPFSLSPSVSQKCTVELSVQCVQRSANICACPYLSCSPWALLSALLEVFPEHSHRVTLEKKNRDTTLSNRAAQFVHPKSPSIQPCCWLGSLGAAAPRTGQEDRSCPGPGSPSTPRDQSLAPPRNTCYQSKSSSLLLVLRAGFPISSPSLPRLAEAAATSGEVP